MQQQEQSGGRRRITVLGSGAWGTTLAIVAARAGTDVTLVVRSESDAKVMREERRHPRSLPGVELPGAIRIETDAVSAVEASEMVILAIPTQKLRAAIRPLAEHLRGRILVSAAKGIEVGTLMLPTAIVRDVMGHDRSTPICALSGPNLATEIAEGKPGTSVIASEDPGAAIAVQNLLMGSTFRVYTSNDVVGVEMGGALKNIIAIGAGIGDGLGAGDNAKAAFMTRGIVEISRLGVANGADVQTFAGLSGIGDLIATCSSGLSRNHRVGEQLARGKTLDDVLAGMSEVAEGVDTTRAAVELATRSGVEMPITEQMYLVLFAGKSPVDAVRDLMMREPRTEQMDLDVR
jgi:glycerol-3-phosphate dehydrogenase (NAD(P)+)